MKTKNNESPIFIQKMSDKIYRIPRSEILRFTDSMEIPTEENNIDIIQTGKDIISAIKYALRNNLRDHEKLKIQNFDAMWVIEIVKK